MIRGGLSGVSWKRLHLEGERPSTNDSTCRQFTTSKLWEDRDGTGGRVRDRDRAIRPPAYHPMVISRPPLKTIDAGFAPGSRDKI